MNEYTGEDRRAYHWHIDKRVSVGHIVTTVMIILGLVSAWTQTQTRISNLETRFVEHSKYATLERERNTAQFVEIKDALRRIEDKLSAKADR